MTFWIIYIIKVFTIQGALFFFYWIYLKRTGRHQFNRLFLLIGLFGAFTIPFMQLPSMESVPLIGDSENVAAWFSEPVIDYEVVLSPLERKATNFSWLSILSLVYILVTLLFFLRSFISLKSLRKLIKQSVVIKKKWFRLFKTSDSRPFSFFSNVFIPESLFDSDDFDQVLAHECEHVKQRHSVDRLLLDFVVSLFWFNPFIYLYRNALIEIHEYQADEGVVKRFKDPIRYQEILFSQLQSPQYSEMVSHFNVSTIKKRIVMINKKNKQSKFIYLVLVPLVLAMIFSFSSKETMKPIEKVGTEISSKIEPVLTFNFSEIENKNDFKPSILPLKNAESVRMTSGFGKRVHPIYKEEKMHFGVDFSCPTGSEVIATADGVVEEVKVATTGYGKMISISHGDKYQSRYAQLSEFKVNQGDKVKRGDVIALSGNSGASTAPHLHYEIIDNESGSHVDPKLFIKNYQFKISLKEKLLDDTVDEKDDLEEYNSRERELAQKEMLLAKEEAERADLEKVKAEEMNHQVSEEMRKAIQLKEEAERKMYIEEKRLKEKEGQKKKNKSKTKNKSDDDRSNNGL